MPLVSVSTVYLPLASWPSVVKIAIASTLPWSSAWYCVPIVSGLNWILFSPYAFLRPTTPWKRVRVLRRAAVGERPDLRQVGDRLEAVLGGVGLVHGDAVGVLERRGLEDREAALALELLRARQVIAALFGRSPSLASSV